MKKIILCFVLVLVTCVVKNTGATSKVEFVREDDSILIDIYKGHPDKRPRDIDYIPIQCSYNRGELKIEFLNNIGNVRITLVNLSSGEVRTFNENTLNHFSYVQMSVAGDYYLEILMQTDDWFYGYFNVE